MPFSQEGLSAEHPCALLVAVPCPSVPNLFAGVELSCAEGNCAVRLRNGLSGGLYIRAAGLSGNYRGIVCCLGIVVACVSCVEAALIDGGNELISYICITIVVLEHDLGLVCCLRHCFAVVELGECEVGYVEIYCGVLSVLNSEGSRHEGCAVAVVGDRSKCSV